MKRIFIFGQIDDFGGREVEVRNIIKSFDSVFNVYLVSLYYMSSDSIAVKGVKCEYSNVYSLLYKKNLLLKFLAILSKFFNKSNKPSYFFLENSISKKIFNFKVLKTNVLKKEIDKADYVIYCGILDLHILKDMIEYCNKKNKKIIIRITGKISKIENYIIDQLKGKCQILVHSESNSKILFSNNITNVKIIDQTTLQEKELLEIPISNNRKCVFGYLGRFSKEKGILELLEIFKNSKFEIKVAGNGPLKDDVFDLIEKKENFLGELNQNDLINFFSSIDVLIIPSFEEAGPLVGIEAMAAGKIIFSTKVGAMQERLKATKNNFWFDILQKDTLIQLIRIVDNMDEEVKDEICESNRKVYQAKYSLEQNKKAYLSLFQ